jgi:hypothetical protein
MKIHHSLGAFFLSFFAPWTLSAPINIPQSALLPLGDPGMTSWIAGDAGLDGLTTVELIAEVTGTAVANSLLLDTQNNGFPAPPFGGVTDDVVVFGPDAVPGAVATVDIPSTCGIALFHDVYDETGEFLSGPDGIINENPVPGTSDAYLSSDTAVNYTGEGRRQLVKYFLVSPAHSYQFTSQWGTVTQLGSGYRAFIFLDDDHSPNYDYDDLIVGVVAPPCVIDLDCADADACNGGETCVEGACQAGSPVVCDNENFCDGLEICVGGLCVDGPPPSCDDFIACTVDACQGNQCVNTPNSATCEDDGLFCNGSEICDALVGCTSTGSPCEASELCNEESDSCGLCVVDEECDDDDPCTTGHACVNGGCQPGVPVDCSASSTQCMLTSCDPAGEPGNCDNATPVANDTPCDDDDDPCTIGQVCLDGACAAGVPVDCSAASTNQCTVVSCDPSGAPGNCDHAVPVEDDTPCDDGIYCSLIDTCQNGICTGSGARDCGEPEGPCLVRGCDPTADACLSIPAPDGAECDDGEQCTVGDACQSGECHGEISYTLGQWNSFAGCQNGPDAAVAIECDCWDLNADGHIDLRDAGIFQNLTAP